MKIVSLLLLALLIGFASLAQAAAPRPNVVFFLIDDLGYTDCGFNGGKVISTPQIDALAKAGTVIENHYVQPVCSPTRSSLMTGRYVSRTGVYTIVRPHAKWGLPLAERTLASALKEAGYETAITGKWHLGEFDRAYLPTSRGFDHQHGHYFGAIDYFTHIRDGSHDWHHNDQELKEEGYSTHLIAKEACRLIEGKAKDKPLFLYVPFNGVHSPMQVPESYLAPYKDKLSGPRLQLAGMLAAVDEAIGQIVGSLEKAGMRENTLIVFSSDNGGPPPGDNTPLHNFKGSIYEGGVRAAAFASWPGHIPAGNRLSQPMHIIDWYPTLIGLAGGSLEQKLPIDGRDIWPMLTQGAANPHDAIFSIQTEERVAIRQGDWKLIVGLANSDGKKAKAKKGKGKAKASPEAPAPIVPQLYNLATDPSEQTNLASQEAERVTAMKAKLDAFMKDAVKPGHIGFQSDGKAE